MKRQQGSVYRPTVIRTKDGKRRKVKSRYYWASYVDANGKRVWHVLKLRNGNRITDKVIARSELNKILERVAYEAAGMIDQHLEAAATPMRVVLARYLRHLRGMKCGRRHINQVHAYVKWICDNAGMERLADFNAANVIRALNVVAGRGRAPRTVNVYRKCVYSLGEWAVEVADSLKVNPVRKVAIRDEKADTRKNRRALLHADASRLLDVSPARQCFTIFRCLRACVSMRYVY